MTAFPLPVRRFSVSRREAALAGLVALAIAAGILLFGPPPGDAPAHLYRTLLVRRGDFVWDNLWFEGVYPLADYSVLYYLPAALVGNLALVLVSATLSAWLFARILLERWGEQAKWPARIGGVLCAAPAFTGLFAYSLGLVAMLGAIRALQRGRVGVYGLLAALTLGFSPLAFLFLLLLLAASFCAHPRVNRHNLVVGAIGVGLAGFEVYLLKLFPSPGVYPFNHYDFASLLALCLCGALLARRAPGGRVIVAFFLLWAAAAIFAFSKASPIGDNITRLRSLVLPLMLLTGILTRFRPRWLAVLAISGALGYNLVPYFMLIPYRLDTRPQHRAFWQPALTFLDRNEVPSYRVEVVETAGNWESYWFPRDGFALVRGWYRQLDLARNPVLFNSSSSGAAYIRWLRSVGVRYVVVPHTTLDPRVGTSELRLVEHAGPQLRPVLAAPTLTVYEVRNATPILTGPGPARLTTLGASTIAGSVGTAGSYRLRVQPTPYLQVRAGNVCVKPASGGESTLVVHTAGRFELAVPENPLDLIDESALATCAQHTPRSP
ncbi:MAG TPA: hypothetical protein VMU74_09670 [Gaiellaceae bacterium]|nr:hypothetical protein [Gaiellaceae bacterium]